MTIRDPAGRRASSVRVALLAAIALALAWFALPTFGAVANEGFAATILMNADAILHGGLGRVDPLYPLDNDFMVLSRFGVSLVLAGLREFGLSAVAALRVSMLVSLAGLVGANAALLVWRYRLHPLVACGPALLFPGLFESAWFLNDNVLSAALSSAAILLLWRGGSLGTTAGAAALWGCAVACRTDAALIAPAFAVIGVATLPSWRLRLMHAALAVPVAVAVPVLIYRAFGLDLLDIVPVTREATALWARHDGWIQCVEQGVKAFAPPGLALVAAGGVATLWRRRWLEAALCVLVPLLYAAAYGPMLTEVRYLLPLSPFFGIGMVEGWLALGLLGAGWRRRARAGLAMLGALCVLPPLAVARFAMADHDMTRPLVGRLWSPALGAWWNATLEAGTEAMAQAVRARIGRARPGEAVVVVSAAWTPDRAVDLMLRGDGFRLDQDGLPDACRRGSERFRRGDAAVVHVRTHVPMNPAERSGVNWELWGAPCVAALGLAPEARVLVFGWTMIGSVPEGLDRAGVTTLSVPRRGWGPGRAIEEGRYGYVLADVAAGEVLGLLSPAAGGDERRLALLAARMQIVPAQSRFEHSEVVRRD